MTMQIELVTLLSRLSNCCNVSLTKGDLCRYLCGTYTVTKKIGQIDPCKRTYAILEPTQPELCILSLILGKSMMTTPAPESLEIPSSSSGVSSEGIQIFDDGKSFCLLCISVIVSTSYLRDLQ